MKNLFFAFLTILSLGVAVVPAHGQGFNGDLSAASQTQQTTAYGQEGWLA